MELPTKRVLIQNIDAKFLIKYVKKKKTSRLHEIQLKNMLLY